MREDALPDGPGPVPKKRRQLEAALDVQIAMWLASDDITPSERRRVQAVKDQRKALTPDVRVGIVVGREGMTPQQQTVIHEATRNATEVHYSAQWGGASAIAYDIDVPFEPHADDQDLIRASTVALAAPKETRKPDGHITDGVWAAIRYAKHRKIPVTIIMPDGTEGADQ